MWYMIAHLWFWLLLAFLVGGLVGWKTCGRPRG
jgi:hypothetical protein